MKQDNDYVRLSLLVCTSNLMTCQMLNVTLYDPSRELSSSDSVPIGVHDLIFIYGGKVDWRSRLAAEMRCQVSALLITGICPSSHEKATLRRSSFRPPSCPRRNAAVGAG